MKIRTLAVLIALLPSLAFAQSSGSPTFDSLKLKGASGLLKATPGTGAVVPASPTDITGTLGYTPPNPATMSVPTYDPGGNLCLSSGGVKMPPNATACPGTSPGGVVGLNATPGVPAAPTLVMNAGPQRVTATWTAVTASDPVAEYGLNTGVGPGAESLSPVYVGQALTYQIPAASRVYANVVAQNKDGISQSSVEASASPIALPSSGTCAQLYAGLIGSNCGAGAATSVTSMAPAILASYGDPVAFNTFMGWAANSGVSSVHSGHAPVAASPTDWSGGVDFWLGGNFQGDFGTTGYAGPKYLSLPLVPDGPTGASGELLGYAAAGNYNSQYYTFGTKIMHAVDINQPINGQVNIDIRTAEEFNQDNGASHGWAMGSQPANLAAAISNMFNQLDAAETAYTQIAGHTKPHMKFVVCIIRDGQDPRPVYNAITSRWDVLAEDNYVNHAYGDPTDPDADFTFTSTGDEWGLGFLDSEAIRLNKREALPEWGVQYDNYGAYIKKMQAWVQAHPRYDYITYWNNNGGGYPGLMSDLHMPQTAAMFRHVFNPTGFPVEPLPYPTAISATGGNGTMTVTATAVPASANATNYLLYDGSAGDGENVVTPFLTASTPSFTFAATNNVPAFFKMAAGNATSVGFLSGEAYDTPRPPPANTPSHYVTMGSSGIVSTAYQSSYSPTGSFCRETVFSPATSDLTGGDHPLESAWGPDGYAQSYYWGETNGQLLIQLRDNANHVYRWVSTGAILNVGSWYDGKGCYDPTSGNATFTLAANGSTPVQIGLPIAGQAAVPINIALTNPSTYLAPAVILGGIAGGGDHFAGSIANDNATNAGVQVLNPIVGASAVNDNSPGAPAWSLSGGAAIHSNP